MVSEDLKGSTHVLWIIFMNSGNFEVQQLHWENEFGTIWGLSKIDLILSQINFLNVK